MRGYLFYLCSQSRKLTSVAFGLCMVESRIQRFLSMLPLELAMRARILGDPTIHRYLIWFIPAISSVSVSGLFYRDSFINATNHKELCGSGSLSLKEINAYRA